MVNTVTMATSGIDNSEVVSLLLINNFMAHCNGAGAPQGAPHSAYPYQPESPLLLFGRVSETSHSVDASRVSDSPSVVVSNEAK